MDRQNVFDWLWTVNSLGCGNIRIWDIMDNFRSAAAARAALEDRGRRRGVSFRKRKELRRKNFSRADKPA